MVLENFEQFVDRLREIRDLGYVETHRAGNTGIGKTLEDLLGIEENNIPGPDVANVELKSARKGSSSMTTLFTKEPPRDERVIWTKDLIQEIGYTDEKGRPALKVTIRPEKPNNRGLYLSYDERAISVSHEELGVCASYPLEYLQATFEDKLDELVMVFADTKEIDEREHFWYNKAYHLDGFDTDEFLNLMRDSIITLDLRMHLKDSGTTRNHGTAWRILKEEKLDRAFSERTPLLEDEMDIEEVEEEAQEDTQRAEQREIDEYYE